MSTSSKARPHPQTFRGVHYDLARGNYDSLESLRQLTRFTAECGLNELVLYMEDLWKYRRHPQLANARAYKLEDMGRLAEYAKTQGIDFIPSFTTMGHARHILEKPKYRHLAFPNSNEFNVLNPAVYELFDELFREVLPYFSSPYVFINGDEMNLSQLDDKAKDVARERGLGALHGQAMGRIARMILEYGRRPIMWHDMLFHHPEGMDYLPEGTIIAFWFYDHQHFFPAVPFLCSLGLDVIAAPAVIHGGHLRVDYARSIPNIEAQTKGASLFAKLPPPTGGRRHGVCLGTLTTIWEQTGWKDSPLGIYATGQWTHNPRLSRDAVLRSFGRDVFGTSNSGLGRAWMDATLFGEYAALWKTALAESRDATERKALSAQLKESEGRLKRNVAAMLRSRASRNPVLHQHMKGLARAMAAYRPPKSPASAEPELLSPALVDPRDQSCHVVERRTKYGHRLVVLTNGVIAVAILPEFGASMIEWVLLGKAPWSVLSSSYAGWAGRERRIPGDPAMGSPWAASSVGGWRETIFFNARLNPSSLWGRPFALQVKKCRDDQVTIECVGQNEVAAVHRTITLERGQRTILVDSEVTNRLGPCYLAVQPNVPHHFPGVKTPWLRICEGEGRRRTVRCLLKHDGTKLFPARGNLLRIESPRSGHYLQLRFRRDEVARFLTDASLDWFTLEPFGVVRPCKEGQSVRMRLAYEFGQA